jgi:SOS-response transcriptional repressor LexA
VYDNIAQSAMPNGATFSHGRSVRNPRQYGVDTLNEKLKALRKRGGLSVRKMAAALDMAASTYAAYEDPAKFKKPIIPLDFAKKIASVLEPLGVSKNEVMALAGLTGEFEATAGIKPANPEADDWLTVTGSVAAGVWKETTDWPASEQYSVRFGPSSHPRRKRFAVRMEGLSMNRTIQPGADLECLWVKFSPILPMPGDLVIVERKNHDLVELTCKRLAMDGEDYVLLCESYEPEFQDPIPIGRPDQDANTDDEVRVVGIVLSAKLDLAPKGLSQRKYRR